MMTATAHAARAMSVRSQQRAKVVIDRASLRCLYVATFDFGADDRHQHHVHHERHAEADEPGVVVKLVRRSAGIRQIGRRFRIALQARSQRPGSRDADGDAEHQRDDGQRIEAAGVPVGPVLLVQAGQIELRAADDKCSRRSARRRPRRAAASSRSATCRCSTVGVCDQPPRLHQNADDAGDEAADAE